ncbi:MAG: class I SAM-dependent methyltransferase [Candidatus Obscuribacterales bacterium]|nr:class I SAM-dependent methyltransferase [Candidatus Obscuribacterales bacterium]
MRLVKIAPPGTFCHQEAIMEMVKASKAKTFIELGCGDASLSSKLCAMGLSGIGVDMSADAIEIAGREMKNYIDAGKYKLVFGDALALKDLEPADLALSIMVMEHVEDDESFLKQMKSLVKAGGHLIVAVPGRRDCWSFEDDTVGHYRRYDRSDMENILKKCGLNEVCTWSVGVPTVNLLWQLTNFMLKRNAHESGKINLSKEQQTASSGIREIPFKTVFPPLFKIILNRVSLSPLFFAQRFFYKSNLGLIIMSLAKKPAEKQSKQQVLVAVGKERS